MVLVDLNGAWPKWIEKTANAIKKSFGILIFMEKRRYCISRIYMEIHMKLKNIQEEIFGLIIQMEKKSEILQDGL